MDNSFENMIQVAGHIKSYQLSFDRQKFDSLPDFYKTGLYYNDMFTEIRSASFEKKKEIFNINKEEGIKYLAEKNYDEALFSFCKSLCVFKYIKSAISEWKKEAIKDTDLTYVDEEGEDEAEKSEILKMKISALLNIALCCLGLDKFEEARQACDEVIKIDSSNVKAYYRKSRTYIDCKASSKLAT
jgi:tetratricopeptide (TPR) repeat protein